MNKRASGSSKKTISKQTASKPAKGKKAAVPPKKQAPKAPLKGKAMQPPPSVRHTKEKVSKTGAKSGVAKKAAAISAPLDPRKTSPNNKTSINNMAAANEVQKQKDAFEKAHKLFHSRNFAEAMKQFQAAAQGPSIDITHVARLHAKMCEQRLQKEVLPLESAEDQYNYAVSLLNQKTNLEEAEKYLRAAVQAKDSADHYHYALALCLGLRGDFAGSSQHLARAIALAPNNRAIARNDPDFREVLQVPAMRELLASKV